MGENNIIAGNSSFKKIMKIATLISCVITVMSLALVILIPILMDKTREYMRENSIYLGGDLSLDIQKRVKRLYTLYVLREWNTQLLPLFVFITIAFLLIYFYVYSTQIVVTDKRVYGKTSFGKQVDLPLDSISSVGTNLFKGITVGTSSGRIKFIGISNRNDVYKGMPLCCASRKRTMMTGKLFW